MVRLNVMYIFSIYMYLSITVIESHSKIQSRNRVCPPIHLNNGRVKLRSSGRVARITCNRLFKLIQGSEIMTCVRGHWDTDFPICGKIGCTNVLDNISHGKLIVVNDAKLEIECDVGYVINGPSFTFCNEDNEWNDELKGCRENDRIYSSCDFESSDGRLCGWQNDRFNDIDWLADKMSISYFTSRRHVAPGSSQYFTNNYISLDAGNYGSSYFGKLISPPIPPVEINQRCLIFSYKVLSGSSYGAHTLTVTFGNVPHWITSEGEGRVIIGLYKFNVTSQVIIEGKNCKAAIDNIIITEGHSCSQKPYEDEFGTCHDNCGKTYDDNSCSCDWECDVNDNCCSDISEKCPYIKPLEEINRLYLTTVKPITGNVTKVFKNTLNFTNIRTTISPIIINESIISNGSIRVLTPIKRHNVTDDEITNVFIPNMNTTQIPFSYNTTITEKPTDIPKQKNYTKTITTTYSDIIINKTITPKVMNIPNVNTNILVKSTTPVVIIPINSFEATTKPSVMNTTNTARVFNTFKTTSLSNSSITNTTFSTKAVNSSNNTTITTKSVEVSTKHFEEKKIVHIFDPPIQPLIATTSGIINSSNNATIITKLVDELTTNPIEKKSITSLNFTIQPLMTTTSSIIDAPNTTIKSLIENSTHFTKLNNYSSTMKTFSSTFNEPNSFEQSHITFKIEKLKVEKTTQNNVIIENKINTTTFVPNTNNYTVPNEDNINEDDIDHSNLNLSHFIYETNTQQNNYNSTLKNNKSPLNNDSILNEGTVSIMLNSDNTPTKHMEKSDDSQSFSVSYVVIIVKYLAAIGVILITVKYSFSFIRLYFKKPIDDDMDSYFIKTDSDSTCNMELKSHRS